MADVTIHAALCANERYFPGLFCAVGSALWALEEGYCLATHVIDAGLAESSRQQLEQLVSDGQGHSIHWLPVPSSFFDGIYKSNYHISSYYRLALPEILELEKVIYLDSDTLVFGCLGDLWQTGLACKEPILAVQDWETSNLADDSEVMANNIGQGTGEGYFNAGVMVMNLDCLRRENFTFRACAMLRMHGDVVRFADQTALNWHCAGRWGSLEKRWNCPAWAFDRQEGNSIPCICHFTNSAPWLDCVHSPSQALFERVAQEFGLDLPMPEKNLGHIAWRALMQWVMAPARVGFQLAKLTRFKQIDGRQGSDVSASLAHYWWRYFVGGPAQVLRFRRRIREIRSSSFLPFGEFPHEGATFKHTP